MTEAGRHREVVVAAIVTACLLVVVLLRETARAAFPGTPGAIAFSSNRSGHLHQIYRMNADGFGQTRLTDSPGVSSVPEWSAGGGLIAFTNSQAFGSGEVYLMNADGSNEYALTSDPAYDAESAWFPREDKIAFTTDRTGNSDIYVAVLDGFGNIELTKRITTSASEDWDVATSPDGRRLAFRREDDLYVMKVRPEGPDNRPVRLTRRGVNGQPDWSPDGAQITFVSGRSGNSEVYRMKASPEGRGNRPVNLSRDAAIDEHPAWSPDGKKVAFTSERSGNADIWRTRASDGANQVNLTNNPAEDRNPSWQPIP